MKNILPAAYVIVCLVGLEGVDEVGGFVIVGFGRNFGERILGVLGVLVAGGSCGRVSWN